MTTAFVLSGGGSLGAIQVGMLRSLAVRGIRPDLVVGTSAGALNAAYIAGHGAGTDALDELARIWTALRRRDVFPLDPLRQLLALRGWRPSLCPAEPLRDLVARHLTYRALDDAPATPVHVITTDLLSGKEVVLSCGDAVSAVLASAAIPGILPPVEREGRLLVDGGVADNTAISQAVALGAERVVVLPTGFACALERPPSTPLATATHALTILIQQRLILEVAHFAPRSDVELLVVPPLCPLDVSSTDFRHAARLISDAERATGEWIDDGGFDRPRPERFLSLHHHAHRSPRPGGVPA